jgi:predicted pyridoxine 5'-phosphate oxidase superfamily flavin-nucleotide-binding protein
VSTTATSEPVPVALLSMRACFEGAIPSVVATADAAGRPNVTYLSCARVVDDERVALSNQFFSKTTRNLAENPRASVMVIDPRTYDEYRLTVVYERTDRRGPVFERLRNDVETVAALSGMQDVFKLRSADIYRVVHMERVLGSSPLARIAPVMPTESRLDPALSMQHFAELSARLARCTDLAAVVATAIDGLSSLLGYEHALVLLLDEHGERLYTIASHGYPHEGVGSEEVVGEGLIGSVAARAQPLFTGGVQHMRKYSRTVRREYEEHDEIAPGREIPLPGLPDSKSQAGVPMMVLGELVGVLFVESAQPAVYGDPDVALLSSVASLLASAIEIERRRDRDDDASSPPKADRDVRAALTGEATHVRFFAVDGSTFIDGDYLIKGVAGRILWSLLRHHVRDGRVDFTNKEMRLDPSLELPEVRDNFESRLILLQRRLDERAAAVRIDKTGRGRFRLVVDRPLRLDAVTA